ncbi:MAG: hypothetical protein JWM88_315 [Verrucomicrobia bacterium]|nr:hypothetical protein [Verrucomicrobiota bacterium]
MILRLSLFSTLALGATLLASPARAQSVAETVGERAENRGGEGEGHLVLAYKCAPKDRAAFREHMDTKGVARFEEWKSRGTVKNYLILFSTVSNESLNDMWVILDFEKFADIAGWWKIEEKFPAGLGADGLALATPKSCVYTDLPWRGGTPNADLSQSVFMIIPYQTLVPVAKYNDFVESYVIPQLKGWVKSGLMPSYQIHMDQNPTNSPWDSLLVFEYNGIKGISLRDTLKNDVRKLLKDDAGYRKYSPIKLTIRKEDQPTTYVAILPKK